MKKHFLIKFLYIYTQIIETDPSDASFRFRITWSKNCSVRYNSNAKTNNGSGVIGNGNGNNISNGSVKLLNANCVSSTGCENERYS